MAFRIFRDPSMTTTPAGDDDYGRYQILRVIGEGGMDTVYLAEQRLPIRRQVALKVVKLGMDTNQVLARFAHERQALAMMDHPNIARIFDAGATAKGRPYFVMTVESTTKAWQFRNRVSDRERFFIEFSYERQVTGNLEKAYQTLESWFETYPRGEQPNAQGLLAGLATHGTGRYERAIDAAEKSIAAEPDIALQYTALASSNFLTGHFSEAERALQRAAERKLEMPHFLVLRYSMAVLNGDRPEMERAVSLAKGKPRADAGWLTRRLSRWLAPVAYTPLRSHRSGPSIWPCKRGNAKRQRVIRPPERYGKLFAGMLQKRRGTRWRRSSFREAGMSNTPPALRSVLLAVLPN
jgi:hypothetical protein